MELDYKYEISLGPIGLLQVEIFASMPYNLKKIV